MSDATEVEQPTLQPMNAHPDGYVIGTSVNCPTMDTIGMHLEDVHPLLNRTFEAAKLFATAADAAGRAYASSLFPTWFLCKHCNAHHIIEAEDVVKAIFGNGGIDFSAGMDQLRGILEYRAAAAAGKDWRNNTSVGSEHDIAAQMGVGVTTNDEEPENDGTDSAADGAKPGK